VVKILYDKWVGHLAENEMTYSQHFNFAILHGLECIKAGMYLIIHGLFPCFYRHAGSDLVHKLDKVFTEREEASKQN
jgi:hypothetical protein